MKIDSTVLAAGALAWARNFGWGKVVLGLLAFLAVIFGLLNTLGVYAFGCYTSLFAPSVLFAFVGIAAALFCMAWGLAGVWGNGVGVGKILLALVVLLAIVMFAMHVELVQYQLHILHGRERAVKWMLFVNILMFPAVGVGVKALNKTANIGAGVGVGTLILHLVFGLAWVYDPRPDNQCVAEARMVIFTEITDAAFTAPKGQTTQALAKRMSVDDMVKAYNKAEGVADNTPRPGVFQSLFQFPPDLIGAWAATKRLYRLADAEGSSEPGAAYVVCVLKEQDDTCVLEDVPLAPLLSQGYGVLACDTDARRRWTWEWADASGKVITPPTSEGYTPVDRIKAVALRAYEVPPRRLPTGLGTVTVRWGQDTDPTAIVVGPLSTPTLQQQCPEGS